MRLVPCLVLAAALAPASGKRTVVRFDDDSIDGKLQRPETELTEARRERLLRPLFRPPANFDDKAREEALQAAENLRGR